MPRRVSCLVNEGNNVPHYVPHYRVVGVVPPNLIDTPASGFSFSSRTWPARTVWPAACTFRRLVPVRVTAAPSMVAVPLPSIEELLGVLPVVMSVRSPEALGPRLGGLKLAITPAGREPDEVCALLRAPVDLQSSSM